MNAPSSSPRMIPWSKEEEKMEAEQKQKKSKSNKLRTQNMEENTK